ncbi:MAG: alpha/beta hydrolase [Synergistaceae bacterium]|nr:alpha/beta hydrolase [Synergistaceae bacterium]
MKTRDVTFYSEGSLMKGTIYLPEDYKEGEKRRCIVANSGWTGLNKVYPALFARAMTAHGFVCMGFDYRGFKPSGGTPKYTTLEMEVDDICNAVTFVKTQSEVDAERVGLIGWGTGGAVCVAVAARDETVKAVAMLNSFVNGTRWMHMGMGNDKYYKILRMLEEDKKTRVTTGDPVLRHPYVCYPNIEESGGFYVDQTLKKLNGGVDASIAKDNDGEEFPTPMSTVIGESFLRFNIEELLPKLAPRALFIGHGRYNELHDKVEAEEAYRLAKEPKLLYWVEGKHNEWMFDNDPKLNGLTAAMAEFFKKHL